MLKKGMNACHGTPTRVHVVTRQVMLGPRSVDTNDYEVINSYRPPRQDGVVIGRQRSAVYLTPQDRLYFEAENRAVAIYDYDVVLTPLHRPRTH